MVVLLIAVVKGEKRCSAREFANGLKQIFDNEKIDQKKVVPLNLDTMKNLITSNLDSLLKTNDELIKDDNEIESFLKTLEKKIMEIDPKTELQVAVRGNIFKIDEGITNFSWDENRFPKNQKTIDEILAKINEKYNATRQNLKVKQDEYNADAEKLKNKKRADNEALALMKTDYRDLIKNCTSKMITTDYLCTILCFVPHQMKEAFLKKYMELAGGMVVPLSAERLDPNEDEKVGLWRVVVMSHAKEDFKNQCQSMLRVQCRDYDEEEIRKKPEEAQEIEAMSKNLKEKRTNLLRNSISGYSEVYSSLLHLKFLRLYVEASLKYGSSEYFASTIFIPLAKEQKAVKALINAFSDTKEKDWYGTKEDLKETEDFYPFILIKVGCPSTIMN